MLYGFKETITYIKTERNNFITVNVLKMESNLTSLNSTDHKNSTILNSTDHIETDLNEGAKDSFKTINEVCKHFHFILILWILSFLVDELVQVVILFKYVFICVSNKT